MGFKHHGKYTHMNKRAPSAIARCDHSGMMVKHSMLQKQMQYSGAGLYWTGLWVYPKFLDKPNPQNLAPRVKLDPVPVPHAKPDEMVSQNPNYQLVIDMTGLSSYQISFAQGASNPLIISGTPSTNPFTFQLPPVLGVWTVSNATSLVANVSQAGPISSTNPIFEIAPQTSMTLYGNGLTLSDQPFTP